MRLRLGSVLLLASVAVAGAGGRAWAAVPGHSLSVERRCGTGALSIAADPSLSGAVEIQGATSAVGQAGPAVDVSAACGDQPLTLLVPPDFPVSIVAGGSGEIRLGDLEGPVTASLRDDVSLEGSRLDGPLNLALDGDGDAHVDALRGPVVVRISGSSDLKVGRVESEAFALTDAGSGDVAIDGGRIGNLKATLSGSGDLRMAGIVGGGEVVTAGSGDISIARVVGNLVEVQTGSGDISIRDRGEARRAQSRRHGISAGGGSLAVLAPIALLLFAVLLRRRRLLVRESAPAGAGDPRVGAAVERLTALSRRLGRMEALVTSREFELERRFRDL